MSRTYDTDRAFANRTLHLAKGAVGNITAVPTSPWVDNNEAADLELVSFGVRGLGKDIRVASRLRRAGYEKYEFEFTLRCWRLSGVKTELEKILEGYCDWLIYGHVSPCERFLTGWWGIDLNVFRACYALGECGPLKVKPNKDGTTKFRVFNVRQFPRVPPLVLGTNRKDFK